MMRPMSQENLDLLRRGFEHTARTGEMLAEIVHPDVVWDTTTFVGGLNLKRCVGVDEINAWLAEWVEAFETWSIDIEEVVDGGDRVVTCVRQHATVRHGPDVDMHLAFVWTFRDGLVSRTEMHADRAAALEAAGLEG